VSDLLTQAEHNAVITAALLAEQVAEIAADGPSRDADIAEAAHHIHAVQRMILAQAAARAYPERYRLLGGTVAASKSASGRPTSITEAIRAYKERTGTS
jgi:hypothetical protein